MKFSAEDLIFGRKFWVPVVLVIFPTVIGALQVSLHGSRLTVTLESSEPEYEAIEEPGPKPAEYLGSLAGVIQRELAERVASPFSASGHGETGINKEAVTRQHLYFAKVKLNVKSQVTNIGSKPSSLKEITWYLVEETDGRRETIDVVTKIPSRNIKLPESEPVELEKDSPTVEFMGFGGWRLLEYETVRIIEDSLRRFSDKEKPLVSLADPYIRLLHLHDPGRRDRALRIADPAHHSSIMVGIEVSDIYGRMAHAETVIIDSSRWRKQQP